MLSVYVKTTFKYARCVIKYQKVNCRVFIGKEEKTLPTSPIKLKDCYGK